MDVCPLALRCADRYADRYADGYADRCAGTGACAEWGYPARWLEIEDHEDHGKEGRAGAGALAR